jgi:NAD(P)-dependent dehydrogenase (short-subunit alcohol dehydrogenase family)
MELPGKVALITGGAVRVGRAICRELATGGASVFCHYYRSQAAAIKLQQELHSSGRKINIFSLDLMQADSEKKLLDEVILQCGRIDILINSAAVFYKTPFGNITAQDWDTFFTLNLKQAFFLSQHAASYMMAQKSGKIINIADAAAASPFPAYLPYSLSKAAVVAMTRGLAKALAPHIQVNCISPGPVMIPESMPDEERQTAINQTLLKREGSAQDVAKTARFLLEDGDYITGAVIPVDGGREIR